MDNVVLPGAGDQPGGRGHHPGGRGAFCGRGGGPCASRECGQTHGGAGGTRGRRRYRANRGRFRGRRGCNKKPNNAIKMSGTFSDKDILGVSAAMKICAEKIPAERRKKLKEILLCLSCFRSLKNCVFK